MSASMMSHAVTERSGETILRIVFPNSAGSLLTWRSSDPWPRGSWNLLGSVARLRVRYDESNKQQVAFNVKLDVRAGS